MTIKEVKAALEKGGTKFSYSTKFEVKTFHTHQVGGDDKTGAIYEDDYSRRGMNVKKFGPTCVTLYTFDMLGNKTVGKIRYEDVEILETEEFIFVDGQKVGK